MISKRDDWGVTGELRSDRPRAKLRAFRRKLLPPGKRFGSLGPFGYNPAPVQKRGGVMLPLPGASTGAASTPVSTCEISTSDTSPRSPVAPGHRLKHDGPLNPGATKDRVPETASRVPSART